MIDALTAALDAFYLEHRLYADCGAAASWNVQ